MSHDRPSGDSPTGAESDPAPESDSDGTDGGDWQDLFGFEEPYANQADAIETAIDVGRRNGYLAMEGPCGTGKTMAALTAAAFLIRHTDQYDNAVVVTPVKQQLQQFVADLRTLNAGLETPFAGVALVGKADLCPYGREGAFPDDVGVHTRCEDLRDATADLVEADENAQARLSEGTAEVAIEGMPADDVWWDSQRALDLVRAARLDADSRSGHEDALTTAGVESPYPRAQPTAPTDMAEGEHPPLYCPFEADWYARNKGSPIGFEAGEEHVVTVDEYLPGAVERGTCPHRAMGVLLDHADIVIGNYNHLFDPQTRPLTEAILNERTFVIVDEAHRLEERVRDLLSDTIGRQTLRRARGDLQALLRAARQDPEHETTIEAELAESDVTLADVERAAGFYDDVLDWLHTRVDEHLRDRFDNLDRALEAGEVPDEELEIPLRNPETEEPDALTEWAGEQDYMPVWRSLAVVGAAVERALDGVDPDRSCVCTAAGALMEAWHDRDHVQYFREITLDYAPTVDREPAYVWERAYTPGLLLYNCMPAGELARIFADLGGGILMSATLEPLDVFKEVSGLDAVAASEQEPERPVVERTYELPFPDAHRASWIVDATPFTAANRGPPDPDNRNDTREEYARILRDIATSPGNVMLCLPNYGEAAWAGARLREEIDKPVLVDESSSAEATEDLKQAFFRGDGKVLVTSTRGTLTEGVDYDGDKLATCAVLGVPLVNIGSPRVTAVRQAYGAAFGDDRAFEYAVTVPAVRRARQAIGRVIRGPEERGVRILADNRYTQDAHFGSVYEYLPETERQEFVRMTPMFLESQFAAFWGDD